MLKLFHKLFQKLSVSFLPALKFNSSMVLNYKRGMWRKAWAVTKTSNSHLYYTNVGAFWNLIWFFKSNYEKVAYFHRYLTFKNAYIHYSKFWGANPRPCCETSAKNYKPQARTRDPMSAKLSRYQYAIAFWNKHYSIYKI